MIKEIEELKMRSQKRSTEHRRFTPYIKRSNEITIQKNNDGFEVVSLHVSPDLGERILISTEKSVLNEIFPETNHAISGIIYMKRNEI
jgi:hypothetical protein